MKGKETFGIAIVLIVLLGLAYFFYQGREETARQEERKTETSQSSSSKKEDKPAPIAQDKEAPFNWTYEDFQALVPGTSLLSDIEEQFGPANAVYGVAPDGLSIDYKENLSADFYHDEKAVRLHFLEQEDGQYVLTAKTAMNMSQVFEEAPEGQEVFRWSQLAFDGLNLPDKGKEKDALAYEDFIAIYGMPHQIEVYEYEGVTEQNHYQSKEIMAHYFVMEDNGEYELYFSFKLVEDGRYHLVGKESPHYSE